MTNDQLSLFPEPQSDVVARLWLEPRNCKVCDQVFRPRVGASQKTYCLLCFNAWQRWKYAYIRNEEGTTEDNPKGIRVFRERCKSWWAVHDRGTYPPAPVIY